MKKHSHFGCYAFLAAIIGVVTSCTLGEKDLDFENGKAPKNPGGIQVAANENAGKSTKKYQSEYKKNKTRAIYVSKDKLDEFVASLGTECRGFRLYRSVNQDANVERVGAIGLIIVGVDKDGNDITQKNKSTLLVANAFASYDRCPDNCDRESLFYDKNVNNE